MYNYVPTIVLPYKRTTAIICDRQFTRIVKFTQQFTTNHRLKYNDIFRTAALILPVGTNVVF